MANTEVYEGDRVREMESFAGSGPQPRNDLVEVQMGNMLQSMERVYGSLRIAYHRNELQIRNELAMEAARAGEKWYYRWPVQNKDGTTGFVEGPSIKCAEEIFSRWGNCDVDTRHVDIGDRWVFASRFIDLQRGTSQTRLYEQYKKQNVGGKMDRDRARDMVFQIGQSKSIRNIIVHCLRGLSDYCVAEAKASLVEKIGKDLPKWREAMQDRLKAAGVDVKRVEKVLARPVDRWLADDIAGIIAVGRAIEDGMATWDESYPPLQTATTADGTVHDKETGEVIKDSEKSAIDELAGTGTPSAQDGKATEPDRETNVGSAATTEKKPPAGSVGEQGMPTTAEAYVKAFDKWFVNEPDPVKAAQRYNAEKDLRNQLKVPEAERDRMKALVDTRLKTPK